MLVFRGFSQPAPASTALTIGNFDGVHVGHHAIFSRIKAAAKKKGLLAGVITFEPHPREFFAPETAPARLTTLREKLELFANEGIEIVYICRFNAAVAKLTADDFIEKILVQQLKVAHLIVGDDFRFGADRSGHFQMLEESAKHYHFELERITGVTVDGHRASSSAIRNALWAGELQHAKSLLGRDYSIDGRVIHGNKIGRSIGFATANIRIKRKISPLEGVFAVRVNGIDDAPHLGVANLGVRPSVEQLPRPLLEVHLLDFDKNIYGKHLNVQFLHKIRNEVHFPNFEALKNQIKRDVEAARLYFQH